mgnify:FL=1
MKCLPSFILVHEVNQRNQLLLEILWFAPAESAVKRNQFDGRLVLNIIVKYINMITN